MKLKVLQYKILKCEIKPKNTYRHMRARLEIIISNLPTPAYLLLTSKVLPRVALNLISLSLYITTSENFLSLLWIYIQSIGI